MLDKLAPAVVAMQAALSPVDKSSDNPFFRSKYAPLPDVRKAMQPILAANGLALLTFPAIIHTENGSQNGLRFYLMHESGQYLEGEWLLTPAKNDSQGQGADTTYKRRFGEMAITGLVADEDDDGHAASRPAPQLVGKRPTQPTPKKPQSEADVKRAQLRTLAEQKGWDLSRVAAAYATKVNGGGGDLKSADAASVEAFITSLETGVITID